MRGECMFLKTACLPLPQSLLKMGLLSRIEIISKVGDVAGKEFAIESALDKMESEWKSGMVRNRAGIIRTADVSTSLLSPSQSCWRYSPIASRARSFAASKRRFHACSMSMCVVYLSFCMILLTHFYRSHIVMTQSMSFSPFKKPFQERIQAWYVRAECDVNT